MLRQDKVWVGLLYGVIFPAVIYFLVYEINLMITEADFSWMESIFGTNPRFISEFQVRGSFSNKFIAILSVCSNIIPFNVFKRTRKDHTMQGVLTATFILVIVLVIVFWDQFLGA